MAYNITPEQRASYEENGYLVISNILTTEEIIKLQRWAREIHDLPRNQDDYPYL